MVLGFETDTDSLKKQKILDFHVSTEALKTGDKPSPLIETFGEKFRPGRLIEQDA